METIFSGLDLLALAVTGKSSSFEEAVLVFDIRAIYCAVLLAILGGLAWLGLLGSLVRAGLRKF